MARALEYAHQAGILHRDIKPANLLLDHDEKIWLADFGLSKSQNTNLTRTGQIVGTLQYMPPERLNGIDNEQGDVYSLGLTLYELATLRPAFEPVDHATLLGKIINDQPPRPRQVDAAIPVDLEMVIRKAIAREPALRYSSAGVLADDLERFADGRPIQARQSSVFRRSVLWSRRKPLVAALLGAVALLLIALTVGSAIATWNIYQKNIVISERLGVEKRLRQDANRRLLETSLSNIQALKASQEPGRSRKRLASVATATGLLEHFEDAGAGQFQLRSMAADAISTFDLTPDVNHDLVEEFLIPDNKWDFSSDLSWIARLDTGGNIVLVALETEKELERFSGDWKYARTLVGGNDQYVAAYGSTNQSGFRVEVWDRSSGSRILAADGSRLGGIKNRCSFSEDGSRFAWLDRDQNIRVIELSDGTEVWRSETQRQQADWLELAPNGRTIIFDQGLEVVMFSIDDEQELGRYQHEQHTMAGCWSSRPGWFATAGTSGVVYVWNKSLAEAAIYECRGHTSYVDSLCFHPDGEMIMSGALDRTTRFWSHGRQILVAEGGGIRFDDAGSHIGFEDADVAYGRWIVNGETRREVPANQSHDSANMSDFSVSPDERLIAWTSEDEYLSFFDLLTRTTSQIELNHPIMSAVFASEAMQPRMLITTREGISEILLSFDESSGKVKIDGEPQTVTTNKADFSRLYSVDDDCFISIDYASEFCLIDVKHNAKVVPCESWCCAAACCQSCDLVAVTSKSEPVINFYSRTRLLDEAGTSPTFSLASPLGKMAVPRFSPDGERMALSSDTGWLVATTPTASQDELEVVFQADTDSGAFVRVAFSSDGQFLAVTDFESTTIYRTDSWVPVIELATPEAVRITRGVVDFSGNIAFVDGDRWLVAGTTSNSILVWDLGELRRSLHELGVDW